MSQKIHRYALNLGVNDIKLPKGAKVLSGGVAKVAKPGFLIGDEPSIWALVDPEIDVETSSMTETRRFLVYTTGSDMSETEGYVLNYLGHGVKSNNYVLHVFEVTELNN